ncbi:peptide/nickel transport system permease protein [Streptosporangium becharense]|uniref:Peptide/nickel transport system permease protein n=1 Tax=Streptosporangium becharense TaxID=1816182 RepID=A0A7W9MJM8_9ACTN|nr:ABC transporter permease [Streptosporangium becharense]MBB2914562.1 peptide/nickel transport system permease protein [Streptosporangium becharense]MBB5823407.1 peptide/nickel transport system permease protein [Streptosporangium becharense]
MRRQILGHAARALSTLLIVLIITFAITRIAYRNPAAVLAPRNADQRTLDGITRALRLDEPWYLQLWHYLYRGPDIQGAPMGLFNWPPALGYSFRQQRPVTELILSKVPVTLSLALGALVIWMTLSILLGVLAAMKPDTWVDRFLSALSYAGLSVPTFLSGILLSYFLYFKLSTYGIRWFPGSGYVGITEDPVEWARHLALPWLTIAIAEIGIFQRVVRGNMLDVLGSDYIRTARAKGVSERRVYFDHALRAALNPIITLSGLELAAIMGGAIVTEQIFGLDGVGRLAVEAAVGGDFPVVIGTTVLAAAIFVISAFAVDVVTRLRDPAGST